MQNREFQNMVRPPNHVFILHTDPYEVFAGVNARLRRMLDAYGYRKEMLNVVLDSNGRPVFEVFRIRPA